MCSSDLVRYRPTAAYGHFGRTSVDFNRLTPGKSEEVAVATSTFTWERTDRADLLARAVRG